MADGGAWCGSVRLEDEVGTAELTLGEALAPRPACPGAVRRAPVRA